MRAVSIYFFILFFTPLLASWPFLSTIISPVSSSGIISFNKFRHISHIKTNGNGPFIFNLGHGILPSTPPEHVGRAVDIIRGAA